MEYVFLLIVMDALDDLGPYKRAFGDDSFQGYHTVEVGRTQGSRIASKFAKATHEGAVVHLSFVNAVLLMKCPVLIDSTYNFLRRFDMRSVW